MSPENPRESVHCKDMTRSFWTVLLAVIALPGGAQSPTIVKIVGENHKLVLFSNGTVGGWGDMRDAQLGPPSAIPNFRGHSRAYVPISMPGRAIDIAAAEKASYVLLDDGVVYAFGSGPEGELGIGESGNLVTETPIPVQGMRDVVSIAACNKAALAVHRDGTVSAWGSREGGIIGDGVRPESWGVRPPRAYSPVRVPGVTGVVRLSVSQSHVLALTSAGTVWSWGKSAVLGRRLPADQDWGNPGEILGLNNVADVVATGVSAVLKKDGTVWVWGDNGQAQFGNGKRDHTESTIVPIQVPGIANALSLAGGVRGRHFIVRYKDGSLRAWGNSDWGQIGNGVTGREQASVAIPKINGVSAVFAAGNNSFAVRSDNTVWAWGATSYEGPVWPVRRHTALPTQITFP
jgi:alpha-tubulin suppressor-like RCC1 family protein